MGRREKAEQKAANIEAAQEWKRIRQHHRWKAKVARELKQDPSTHEAREAQARKKQQQHESAAQKIDREIKDPSGK